MSLFKKVTKNKAKTRFLIFLYIGLVLSTMYMIYAISLWHSIENEIRFAGVIFLLVLLATLFVISIKVLLKKKLGSFLLLVIFKIIYIVAISYIAFNIQQVYSAIGGVTSNSMIYSTSLTTLHSESDDIDNLTTGRIGIYSNENSVDGHQMPNEIIEKRKLKNEVVYIDSYIDLFFQLENEEITYAFFPTNYEIMFQEIEEVADIIEGMRIIYTEEKEVQLERGRRQTSFDEPMTFLLMGIDSRTDDIRRSTFNGDALMVVTFNPRTLNATLLSIPRDTYVPITCFAGERKNKITHAAWHGETCMKETVEKFLDIEIDYVVKMNFRGLVDMVDAVGGIEVDVPYSFCEQDSRGRFGEHTIYVMEGLQELDGEQALALTRNRKNNTQRCGYGVNWANDFVRGQNQQLVLRGLLEKFKDIRNVNMVQDLLEQLGNTMETNMPTNQILSFYNIFRDVFLRSRGESFADIVTIQRLYLSGYDQYIFDYSQINNQGMRSNLYNFIPYQGSVADVVEAMKINLGLIDRNQLLEFSFNVNEPFEETVIGRGVYNEARIALLPDFRSYSQEAIIDFAKKNNIAYEIKKVENTGQYKTNQIIRQTPNARTDLDYVTKIIIEIAGEYKNNQVPVQTDCFSEPNQTACQFPNLVGKTYSQYLQIKNKYKLDWQEEFVDIGHPDYDYSQAGKIIEQSVASGTDIYGLKGQTIKVVFVAELEEDDEEEAEEMDE